MGRADLVRAEEGVKVDLGLRLDLDLPLVVAGTLRSADALEERGGRGGGFEAFDVVVAAEAFFAAGDEHDGAAFAYGFGRGGHAFHGLIEGGVGRVAHVRN